MQEPAKIIMTQKTHRQPRELVVILHRNNQRVSTVLPGNSNRIRDSQTTDNRSENRTKEDGRSEHARGDSSAHGIPHVRKHTAAVGEGRNGKETADKASDEQSRHVVCSGLADVEDGVYRKSADKDGPPTDELRAGSPKRGAERIADEEEGEYEVPYFPPDMEITGNNWYRR